MVFGQRTTWVFSSLIVLGISDSSADEQVIDDARKVESASSAFDLQEFFEFFDENHDGSISLAEVTAGLLDTNIDDDNEEDPAMLTQKHAKVFQEGEVLFNAADVDNDGFLSQDEVKFSPAFQKHILSATDDASDDSDDDFVHDFQRYFDRDNDGQVSLAEVESGLIEANLPIPDDKIEDETPQDASLLQTDASAEMEAVKVAMQLADLDKNDALSFSELQNGDIFEDTFNATEFSEFFDANQDGEVSMAEIEDAMSDEDEADLTEPMFDPRMQASLLQEIDDTEAAFKSADTNGDGFLSANEIDTSDKFKDHILDSTGELDQDAGYGDDLYDDYGGYDDEDADYDYDDYDDNVDEEGYDPDEYGDAYEDGAYESLMNEDLDRAEPGIADALDSADY